MASCGSEILFEIMTSDGVIKLLKLDNHVFFVLLV
jgi:hypothetical protein